MEEKGIGGRAENEKRDGFRREKETEWKIERERMSLSHLDETNRCGR